jgi:hypothetical protein
MPVRFNDQTVLPAPVVTFGKAYNISDDGTSLGASYTVNFAGQILQNKGNPIATSGANFSSTFSSASWTTTETPDDDPIHGISSSDLLISTITKLERLRSALVPATGVKVEVVGFNHNKGIKFYGDVKQFSVESEGNWAKPANYSIDFTCNSFIESANSGLFTASEDNFTYYIESASETWGFQEADQVVVNTGDWTSVSKVYNVTHNLNAKGKRVYSSTGIVDLQPWQQASGYVVGVLGLGSSRTPASFLGAPSGYYASNRKIVENVDKLGGAYSIEESFTYVPSGSIPSGIMALEETSMSIERSEGALTTINLQGTITGLNTYAPTGVSMSVVDKYTNANSYYNAVSSHLYNRVRQNSGLPWVHPMPKTTTVGRLPNAGQITYSYSYDDRPPNLIPGSISEEISVSDIYPGQIFSENPAIGRNQAILTYLGSRSSYRRSLNITVNMNPITRNWSYANVNSSGLWTGATASGVRNWFAQKPSLTQTSYFQGIYDALNPANESGVITSKVFHKEPQENFNVKTGVYTYNIEWTYERS